MIPAAADEIASLKATIRALLHAAAAHGSIDGDAALGILVSLSAEMVARVIDDGRRGQIVADVIECFPGIVLVEREVPEGVTWQ